MILIAPVRAVSLVHVHTELRLVTDRRADLARALKVEIVVPAPLHLDPCVSPVDKLLCDLGHLLRCIKQHDPFLGNLVPLGTAEQLIDGNAVDAGHQVVQRKIDRRFRHGLADAETIHGVDDSVNVERVFAEQRRWDKIVLHQLDGAPYVLSRNGRPEGSACAYAVCAVVRMNLEDQVIAHGPRAERKLDGPYVRDSYCKDVYAIDLHGKPPKKFCRDSASILEGTTRFSPLVRLEFKVPFPRDRKADIHRLKSAVGLVCCLKSMV